MTLRKVAAAFAAIGLMSVLLGAGISASFSDSASATQNIAVGTFACEISSSTPGAIVSPNKHSVTFIAPDIMGSGQSTVDFPFTVTSTGSIGTQVHLTYVDPGTPFSSKLQINSATPDVLISQGGSHTYAGGLQWGSLSNSDLDRTVSITYTATCGEIKHGTFNSLFVCNYIGTPGLDEHLTGAPTVLATNATPGTWFQNAITGGRYYALAYNDGQPTPPASACPVPPVDATVHFWKTVDNTFGGTAVPSDFALVLAQDFAPVATGHDGDIVRVAPGAYNLSEVDPTQSYNGIQGGCYKDAKPSADEPWALDVTLGAGETWYCGFVNQTPPASVIFSNTIVGGTAQPADFTMHLDGLHAYSGVDGGFVDVVPGTYVLTQDPLTGYTATDGVCSNTDGTQNVGTTFTIKSGELWVCGFTNTFAP